jgi:phenylalanyl-tRNA synthetase beta chain
MKISRDWLSDYIDLTGLTDSELERRFTEIGHAVESAEAHGDDTVWDLEITTNRIDAMSHLGMARELSAAFGRDLLPLAIEDSRPRQAAGEGAGIAVSIEAPEMCSRYSGMILRGVQVAPSPEIIRRRLEAVGLRPINNVVDATNYVMLALGHPLHAYDLDKLRGGRIVVRPGRAGETIRSLDGELRKIDPATVVIADGERAIGLGGTIGGAESEIDERTTNVFLECAWFTPAVIRRTARRLGIRTDASYRFERGVDPNDTLNCIDRAAALIVEYAHATPEPAIDVVAVPAKPLTVRLRAARLHEQSAGVAGSGYALELFRRLGMEARTVDDGIEVVVPSWRGDIHEEMDLVEEVLRFHGLDKVPASLPRLTTGDVRVNPVDEAEDKLREILVGCGLSEAINYSFIPADANGMFSDEPQLEITNALSENIAAMRLSLMPGLLEDVAFNRSYGTRDGAIFEIGRTYHKAGDGVREQRRAAFVLFGSIGTHWGDPKRAVDFYDAKGIVEQVAERFHVALTFDESPQEWLRKGKRAVARHGERVVASIGFLAPEALQKYGIKGEVVAAVLDVETLISSTAPWTMAPVARYPGMPMILALVHSRSLTYQRIIETIRSLDVPYLHEVGLRDRFVPDEGVDEVKTTLGLWYQAFDKSLAQDEVGEIHHRLAARLAELLPVKVITG